MNTGRESGAYKEYIQDRSLPIPRRTRHRLRKRRANGDLVAVENEPEAQDYELELDRDYLAAGGYVQVEEQQNEIFPEMLNEEMMEMEPEHEALNDEDQNPRSRTASPTASNFGEDPQDNDEEQHSGFENRFLNDNGFPLFPGSDITENESLLLIFAFATRYKLSGVCLEDLLKLIKLHLPPIANLPTTLYKYERKLGFDYSGVCKNYYCQKCSFFLGEDPKELCEQCEIPLDRDQLDNSYSFFYCFNMKKSLSTILKISEVQKGLKKTFIERKKDKNTIDDICDGRLYKELNLGEYDLTFTANADGVPIFKSSHFELWPILISFNELPFALRRKYIVFSGLWFGSQKPKFDSFLPSYVNQCNELGSSGINWNLENTNVHSKIFFPMFAADGPARCQVQGIKQHNGNCSCPWCIIPGVSLTNPDNPRSHKRVFPPLRIREIKKRTHHQFVGHLREFTERVENGDVIDDQFGVNHASYLLLLKNFDIVNGFVFDYMHAGLLGLARWFASIWFDSSSHGKSYYLGKKIQEIDQKYRKVLVPYHIQRAVRSLLERAFWKACEWKTWILAVPIILKGFLPERYLNHFTLFVSAMSKLCGDKITKSAVDLAEKRLFKFVKQTKILYGVEACSFNLHIFLHAADSVRNWGPLWAYSTFLNENYNGIFLNFFNGTQYVPEQISNRVQEISIGRTLESKAFMHSYAHDFYFSLIENRKPLKKFEKMLNCTFVGKGVFATLSDLEKNQLRLLNIDAGSALRYEKAIMLGKMFSSYSKTTMRRCNSVVSISNKLYLIRFFLSVKKAGGKVAVIAVSDMTGQQQRNFPLAFSISRTKMEHKFVLVDDLDRAKFIVGREGQNLNWVVQLPNLEELE